MGRSQMSLISAALSFVCAVIWLATRNGATGVLWVAISIGWLVASIVKWGRSDEMEPSPGRRLVRRFSRMMMFWS